MHNTRASIRLPMPNVDTNIIINTITNMNISNVDDSLDAG